MRPDQIEFLGLSAIMMTFALVAYRLATRDERVQAREKRDEKKALINLAASYGIEYVPGEDLSKLRARVIERRDQMLGPK